MSDFINNGNDNFTPELNDVVSGVESVPKKKKGLKIAAISAGAVVAVVGGGGAIAYNTSDFVKNKVKLATNSPEEYYAWVVENSSDELSKNVSKAYETYLDTLGKGTKSVVEAKFAPSDELKDIIKDEMGDDDDTNEILDVIDGISSITLGMEANAKGSDESALAYASVNDEKLLSFELAMNNKDMLYFARIPELSEKWIGFDTGSVMKDEMDSDESKMMDVLMDSMSDPSSILTADELGELVKRYIAPLEDFTDEIDLEKKDEIDIGDITVDCSVITLELDGKSATQLAKTYLKTLKEDETIKEIVTKKLGDVTDMDSSDYKDEIQKFIDEIDESKDSQALKSVKFDLEIYVNNKGKICGMGMDESFGELFIACGNDGKNIASEISFSSGSKDSFSLVANLEADGDTYSGEIECSVKSDGDNVKISVELDKCEIVNKDKGYINGSVKIIVPDIDPIALDLKSDGKKQDISYEVEIDGTNYGKITLSMSSDEGAEVKLPSESDAFMIDEDFDEEDLEDYVTLDDIEDFIYNIAVKLGISEESSDQLAIFITDALDAEINGVDDDYGYGWDDDDYDWDYDWDDDDYNYDWDDDDYDWDYDWDDDDWGDNSFSYDDSDSDSDSDSDFDSYFEITTWDDNSFGNGDSDSDSDSDVD